MLHKTEGNQLADVAVIGGGFAVSHFSLFVLYLTRQGDDYGALNESTRLVPDHL